MKNIVLQLGHINCANNSIVALRKNTGAPEEQRHNKEIGDRLSSVLRTKGFNVIQTDACANDDKSITSVDHDLFLALHCDSDTPNDNGGGFADYPEPSTDGATVESQRITGVINSTYFPETKIVYKNSSNANTRFYYMWKYLSAKTPCVLLEMGQSVDPHDSVLLNNVDLIANAIARSVCLAFNVPFDTEPLPTPCAELVAAYEKQLLENKAKIGDLTVQISDLQSYGKAGTAEMTSLMADIQKLSADLDYYRPYKNLYEMALTTQVNKYTASQLLSIAWKKLWAERKAK